MKLFVLISMMLTLGYGQSSHADLGRELLKDLRLAILDSTSISRDSLGLKFAGNSLADSFLESCLPESGKALEPTQGHQVTIMLHNMDMSINRTAPESPRNHRYIRQLELSVVFTDKNKEYTWQGKISDQLSKAQLKTLLDDEFPVSIRGDYAKDEPGVTKILLTSLAVFSLGAALFFIRT